MNLNPRQGRYLERRRSLLKAWRYAGPLLVLGILGLVLFVYANSPLLIDPFEVISRLESGSMERSSLETMATLLPIMLITVFFLLFVLVAILYAAFSNERRYLEILGEASSNDR